MKPELLAPAPTMLHLKAACAAGCDAVYFGAGRFNARRNAGQINDEEIADFIQYAHDRNVRTFLALNTLVSDIEMEDAVKLAMKAYSAGADAFIVQDDGLLRNLKAALPDAEFHSSTQRTVASTGGVKYAEKLGYQQIVLARELSFEEIKSIRKNTGVRLEVFVHGALCYSVSGVCYMSSVIGRRSGNRGLCAQPCRLPYSVNVAGNKQKDHPLSYKELCLIEHIEKLKSVGIDSLKIEGRMRSADYVYTVASVYRKALDGLIVTEEDKKKLREVYSRDGFTDGYFTSATGKAMLGVREKGYSVPVTKFDEKKKTDGYKFGNLDFRLEIHESEPSRLSAVYKDVEVTVSGAEAASGKTLTYERAQKQLSKLGGTKYQIGKLICNTENGLNIPVSEINSLRRRVVEKLDSVQRQRIDSFTLPKLICKTAERVSDQIRFFKLEQLDTKNENLKKYLIWLPLSEVTGNRARIMMLQRQGWNFGIEMPRVTFEKEAAAETESLSVAGKICGRALVGNRSQIIKLRKIGFELYGSFSLNIFNSYSLSDFDDFKGCLISPEISMRQLAEIKSGIPTGVFRYGYLPVMTSAGCVRKNISGCVSCECGQPVTLRDRKNFTFLTFRENAQSCINTILNSVPVYIADIDKTAGHYGFYYFTFETPNECNRIIDMSEKKLPPDFKFTRALFNKGVI